MERGSAQSVTFSPASAEGCRSFRLVYGAYGVGVGVASCLMKKALRIFETRRSREKCNAGLKSGRLHRRFCRSRDAREENFDFNYDFHATFDPKVAPVEYNYRSKAETEARKGHPVKMEGEEHGLSVFFQLDDGLFHTYSSYARGTESLTDAYRLLDMTPYGRQQKFEDSPPGWPQHSTCG